MLKAKCSYSPASFRRRGCIHEQAAATPETTPEIAAEMERNEFRAALAESRADVRNADKVRVMRLAGGTRVLLMTMAEAVNIQDFGHPGVSEAQAGMLLQKERQRFRNLGLEMIRQGELASLPECLEIMPFSRPQKFALIAETFGDMLCEAAQLLIWMWEQQAPVRNAGRHAAKFRPRRRCRTKRPASA